MQKKLECQLKRSKLLFTKVLVDNVWVSDGKWLETEPVGHKQPNLSAHAGPTSSSHKPHIVLLQHTQYNYARVNVNPEGSQLNKEF